MAHVISVNSPSRQRKTFFPVTAFTAGPACRDLVKLLDHPFLYFSVAPIARSSWGSCAQQGRLMDKPASLDGSSRRYRRSVLGGQLPLQFRALPDYRCPIPASTTDTETMSKPRYLSSIDPFYHPRFWPKNGDFSLSDSMNDVSDSPFHQDQYVQK